LIRLGVDVPVEVLEVVARNVLAVLGELDRKAVERAGMQAGQEPFDDELGAQVEPCHLANDFRPQVFLGSRHDAILPARPARWADQYSLSSSVPSAAKKPTSSHCQTPSVADARKRQSPSHRRSTSASLAQSIGRRSVKSCLLWITR